MSKQQECVLKKTSIGGQALIEGVMMRGPHRTAMAVRHTSGEIRMEEWENPKNNRWAITKWPLIRGVFNFIDSMVFGMKCLMKSAEMSGLEEELEDAMDEESSAETAAEKEAKKAANKKKADALMNVVMVVGMVLGVALSLVLFMWLPTVLFKALAPLCSSFLQEGTSAYQVVRGIFEGLLRLLIFLGYMIAVAQMKDIRRTFMYHGAEHKSIFCYEKGLPLTVENVRAQKRFHPRCGTSFMILMLIVGIIISILIPINNTVIRTVVKLLLLPLTVGIGYELIKLAGRKDNWLTRFISAPGVWVQHITTVEPDDSMIECAIKALEAVIPEDGEADKW
ncbi:MAG: DUF1385 domain-containing protein [Clostridia bacterium]|nr:DUF1385 domain-containing protein [Clostridia bacterium]